MKLAVLQLSCALSAMMQCASATAYEINNHADLSQEAAAKSGLQVANGEPEGNTKLFKLGLKAFALTSSAQTFPLDSSLGRIPLCYAIVTDVNGKVVDDPDPNKQPGWGARNGQTWLTVAEMVRYGACYEDSTEPKLRPLAHFYNPQNEGAGLTTLSGLLPVGPSSLAWMLNRHQGNTLLTGTNHYTWEDARDSFYKAVTTTVSTPSEANYWRGFHWGNTFRALGHISHHLQDMAQPQHVRNDQHCDNAALCDEGVLGAAGVYRPSGYEAHLRSQFQLVRSLASIATTPMMFGLPREFWNANTSNSLVTFNPGTPEPSDRGIAAHTSTNFVSSGSDFRVRQLRGTPPTYLPASGLQFPVPSGHWTPARISDLYPPSQANVAQDVVNRLCKGDADKCLIEFMGTQTDTTARASSKSVFAQKILRPTIAYSGDGTFQQNYFTYDDAAKKLVPKAVEYSAGLINYFFRGEFSIRPPEEGLYGLLDGGDTNSNCKDTCGFRKIRARVTNTTAPINGSVQDMTAGTLTAVVKFSRNSCYQPDWSGDLGELGTISYAQQSGCYLGGGTEPVDEVVVSQPIEVNQLAVGSEQAFTFDFSANVIPVNSWNVQLQVVFRGTLGAEPNAVAVSTVRASAPTVLRYINEMDWIDINQNLYRTTDISSTPSLLSALTRQDCYYSDLNGPIGLRSTAVFAYDENGNHIYDENGYAVGYNDWLCFPEWEAIRTNWKSQATGATLASSKLLYQGAQSVLVALGDADIPVQFVIQYPRSYNLPSAPSVTYERSFYLRRLQWNAATPAIDGYQFWNYRGMHTSDVTSRYWKGSESTPWATWEVQKSRPPIRFAEPVPFDSIDSRYQ